MKALDRTTFTTSRLMDFFSRKELIAQTGHQPDAWPLVVLKELVDNAIDACEDHGIAPEVKIKVDANSISVQDDGPGLPADTVAKILDYAVRVSSREAYVSPTRGAQGNAMKTLLAMPFVLDGRQGTVEIVACGIRHEITVRVDPIRQEPVIQHQQTKTGIVTKGTFVKIHWPDSASLKLADASEQFLQIASDFTFLNPHLSLSWDWFGGSAAIKATNTTWKKWLPSYPTSPHWYRLENFERLIAAYLSHDRSRTVREVVSEFDGLTGTAKQKSVLESTGMARQPLSALMNGDGLDHDKTQLLLDAMQANTRPIKPAALGIIGEQHLQTRFAELGANMETFRYKKVAGVTDSIPWIIETAFAWNPDTDNQRLITGVNWSPGIVNPFRELGKVGMSLDSVLERQRAGNDEPILLMLHLACARTEYTDRGKSAVVIGGGDENDE